jgi:hypothetical protein
VSGECPGEASRDVNGIVERTVVVVYNLMLVMSGVSHGMRGKSGGEHFFMSGGDVGVVDYVSISIRLQFEGYAVKG